jgi:hypothetical protein
MKRPQKKWMILGGALLAVLLIGFSVMRSRETGTEVEVETVGVRNLTSIVSASGTVEAKQSVSISATTPERWSASAWWKGSGKSWRFLAPGPRHRRSVRARLPVDARGGLRRAECCRVSGEL